MPGLYILAQSAGLHLLSFAWRTDDYDPLKHINDSAARDYLATLDLPRRQALAEAMIGDIRMHEFFLARQPAPGAVAHCSEQHSKLSIACTPVSKMVYAHMDGATPVSTLRERIRRALPAIPPETVDQELEQIYEQLHARGCLYLLSAGSYGIGIPDYEKLLMGSRPVGPDRCGHNGRID